MPICARTPTMDDKDAILILTKLTAPCPDIKPDTVAVFVYYDPDTRQIVQNPISMDEFYKKSSDD
jgi:hypothetical protein